MPRISDSFKPENGSVDGDRRYPRQTKGERQRQAILDAVEMLLKSYPIGELTVGQIAAEANVGRSGYYIYFDTKFSPLAVLTSQAWSRMMELANDYIRAESESPSEYLDRTARIALDEWCQHDSVLIASIQAIPLDGQIADLWSSWNIRLTRTLTDQVIRDRYLGVAHPASEEVAELVSTLHHMTQHAFYLNRVQQADSRSTERMLESVKTIWLSSAWGIR